MPFVQTQYVLVASEFDSYQLSTNIGENPTYNSISNQYEYSNPKMMEYAMDWSSKTIQLLQELNEKDFQKKNLIFSWACYNHMMSVGFGFYGESVVVDGYVKKTQADAVGLLLDDKLKKGEIWLDCCEGFGCGSGCKH